MTKKMTDSLRNFGEIEKITLEEFKKFSKEEIVTTLLEDLQNMITILLHDEVGRKALHVLTGISTYKGDGDLKRAFVSRWNSILERLYKEDREKFYDLTFWFFKTFNRFCEKSFEKYFLMYTLIKETEEFKKIIQ